MNLKFHFFQMWIYVIFNYGRKLCLDVQPMDLVSDLKELIDENLEYALHQKVLVYRGQFLEDDETLYSYAIHNGSEVYLKPLNISEP